MELAVLFPVMACAASNTIIFKGQLAAQICKVSVNGNEASAVGLMPTISTEDLEERGSTAGETAFTVEVKDCTAHILHNSSIKTAFLGEQVTLAGNLQNAGTAENVQVQMLDSVGGTVVRLDGLTSVPGVQLEHGTTSASHDFAVRYVSEEGGQQPVPFRPLFNIRWIISRGLFSPNSRPLPMPATGGADVLFLWQVGLLSMWAMILRIV